MDKCREEFEEYFKEHHADSFYSVDVALEMRGDDYIDFLASDLWAIWQHQQAKVEELQTLYTQQGINMLKLQKRVDALELKLREIAGIARRARHGEYQTESGRNAGLNIAAEIEQALKGDQYDEHRKKAEEAISKGASLTNHRIEL
ncbi:hypothetical protein L2645_17875 [Acinetobacter baumannii]|uniref:hypothetical protein n=1 Tax=Acinetobacter baumannii TaxID=470 RepID=UPI002148066F|nr:hypothetical protein [Acinetobacter baumannii]